MEIEEISTNELVNSDGWRSHFFDYLKAAPTIIPEDKEGA